MKKVLICLLAFLMVFTAVSCGSDKPAGTDGAKAPGEGATKLGVILVGTRDDYGYNEALYKCVIAAKEEVGFTDVLVKESVPESADATSVMQQLISQGCGIIYATSYGHREYAEELAETYPEVAFFVSNPNGQDLPNIACLSTNLWDAAYVNGVAAGYATKTGKLGYIASFQMPSCIASINAFTLGARSVNPSITVNAVFTGSWADIGAQTNAVNAMISQDIDVIAQYQDYTKTIVELCENNNIYAIGYHTDATRPLAPNAFVTGTLDTFVEQYNVLRATVAGDFEAKIVRGGYPQGMCANAEIASWMPQEAKDAFAEIQDKMTAGEFTTFTGPIKKQDGTILVDDGVTLTESEVDAMVDFVEGVIGQGS